jgi:hypothetical protein
MANSSQIKEALRAHDERVSRKTPASQRAEGARRINLLREKINDDRYLENALEKLAADLARALY